jgi:cobalt-zinc-cadmium resistance protein CzcA
VVVGGLVSATVLTLVLLPALYYLIETMLARRTGAATNDNANAH